MTDRIYSRLPDGSIETLRQEPFDSEDDLQALLADHTKLLDGEGAEPDGPLHWLLVRREQGIADAENAGYRWALDLLLLDQNGTPTLVEVKRASNTELRRTVVGQMVEYAANASNTWTSMSIRSSFERDCHRRNIDPDDAVNEFIASLHITSDEFWASVEDNIERGHFRLLFVADKIPSELEQQVLYMNDQMPRLDIGALEVNRYQGPTLETFVPRLIGGPPATIQTRTARLTRTSFLNGFENSGQRDAADHILDAAMRAGARIEYGVSMVTVRAQCPIWEQLITLAWLYPPNTSAWGRGRTERFSFGLEAMLDNPSVPEELSSVLQSWMDTFANDDFAENVSYNRLPAYAIGYDDAVLNQELLADRLTRMLNGLRGL